MHVLSRQLKHFCSIKHCKLRISHICFYVVAVRFMYVAADFSILLNTLQLSNTTEHRQRYYISSHAGHGVVILPHKQQSIKTCSSEFHRRTRTPAH